MDHNPSTPLFTASYEVANFLASSGVLSKAWEEVVLVNQSETYRFSEHDGVTYVAFPSFQNKEYFIVKDNLYGEGDIQTEEGVFSAPLVGDDGQPASVHQGSLSLFLNIMKEPDFQQKFQIYSDPKQRMSKPVILVGHSLGGAVASFATLWLLERRALAFCVTFGTPLFGDKRLSQAINRENWRGNFCHVVSYNDIVPHIFSAPIDLIVHPLKYLLTYWKAVNTDPSDFLIREAFRALIHSIVNNSCFTANTDVDSMTEEHTEVRRSPYRPFGNYMFCSNQGAACFESSDTIFKILHLMLASQGTPSNENLHACIQEHRDYGSVLRTVLEKSLTGMKMTLPHTESSYDKGICLQLEAIGITTQKDHAWAFFKEAGESEEMLRKNARKTSVYLSKAQSFMAALEWYKCSCKNDMGYYDSFKNQSRRKDMVANSYRLKLETVWDDIIGLWKRRELPCNFQTQNKYINAGTTYRRLVEPLDIANYYRKVKGNGNYLSDGRPDRYKILEKWLHDKEIGRAARGVTRRNCLQVPSLTVDSCFWVHVEEALKDLEHFREDSHIQNLKRFEDYVKILLCNKNVSRDIFIGESSFMQWWNQYKQIHPPEWKHESELYQMIEGIY